MKSYTDIEQSKKLAEILSIESADMYYMNGTKHVMVIPNYETDFFNLQEKDIPCWSLVALLKLIPTKDKSNEYYVTTESHSDYHQVNYVNCWDGNIYETDSEECLLDAAFEMVCWLLENKKI